LGQQQQSAILGMQAKISTSTIYALKTGNLCGRLGTETKHLSGEKCVGCTL